MKFRVTYTRTLTLEEEIEANSQQEADLIAESRYEDMDNKDFDDADGEWEVQMVQDAALTAFFFQVGKIARIIKSICDYHAGYPAEETLEQLQAYFENREANRWLVEQFHRYAMGVRS